MRMTQLAFARDLRSRSTDAERKLWSLLRDRQILGLKFRRQRPIGPYFVDFVCMSRRLVIELDGGQHAEATGRDERRTAFLSAQGYHVVRFWDHDMLTTPDAVLEALLLELPEVESDPHPRPLP